MKTKRHSQIEYTTPGSRRTFRIHPLHSLGHSFQKDAEKKIILNRLNSMISALLDNNMQQKNIENFFLLLT